MSPAEGAAASPLDLGRRLLALGIVVVGGLLVVLDRSQICTTVRTTGAPPTTSSSTSAPAGPAVGVGSTTSEQSTCRPLQATDPLPLWLLLVAVGLILPDASKVAFGPIGFERLQSQITQVSDKVDRLTAVATSRSSASASVRQSFSFGAVEGAVGIGHLLTYLGQRASENDPGELLKRAKVDEGDGVGRNELVHRFLTRFAALERLVLVTKGVPLDVDVPWERLTPWYLENKSDLDAMGEARSQLRANPWEIPDDDLVTLSAMARLAQAAAVLSPRRRGAEESTLSSAEVLSRLGPAEPEPGGQTDTLDP